MPESIPDRTGWMTGPLVQLPACPPFPALTDFEARAVQFIASTLASDEIAIRAQLSTARAVDRINTGHGFYTRIVVERATTPSAPALRAATARFNAEGFEHGVGVILWDEEGSGYLATIEGFVYGDSQMDERDLATLKFGGPA
jgi:hypothetical protein